MIIIIHIGSVVLQPLTVYQLVKYKNNTTMIATHCQTKMLF